MSQIFPKNKEKRPRSSDESNNSFVKNVTSRVSGLLPSTITKWFSSPSTSNANGTTPIADASDSSDDDNIDTPVITQPPAKRMRFSPGAGIYNHYAHPEPSCSTSDVEIIELPYSPFSGPQFAQPGHSRNTYTTQIRPPHEEQDILERDPGHAFKLPHTMSNVGQSVATKRKSIFDTTTKEETDKVVAKSASNSVRDPKQPSFKPSLLGSPFYPGRTMYGGAATSSYINQPNIKQQTVAVVNESNNNDDSAISSSARRIMDLLESYSSPLMEARRIPLYTKPKNDRFLNNTSIDKSSSYSNKSTSYKTQELHVPSIASILRLKKKSRLMDTTNIARQIIASHSSASHLTYPTATENKGKEPVKEQPSKMTTKVKSRLTRTHGAQESYEVVTPVKLPQAVLRLDPDKMPHFTLGTPPVSKLPATATSTPKISFPTADKKIGEASASKHETISSSGFTFSNPVKVSNDTAQVGIACPKFTFDSPERRIDQKIESKRDDCSVVVGVKEFESTTSKSKEWQCSECWVKNKSEVNKCVCCGAKQPIQKSKCSVCKLADTQSQKDKCANCEKMSISQVASPLTAISTAASKWKCEDCWVSNDDSAVKCACCGGSRPKKSTSTAATVTVSSFTPSLVPQSSTSQIVPLKAAPVASKGEGDWKCDDCWISNKSSVDKCAACGGARPGAKQTNAAEMPAYTPSFFGSSDNKFKTIAQSQKSETWECSGCLVRNESTKDKCVCCGAEKENKGKIPDSKFNFGKTLNSSFKFGIDHKAQEAAVAKQPEVIPTLQSKFKPQSETNNNILSETPTFTFNLPTRKIENKNDTTKAKIDEVPKMNFTFGIPKPSVPTSTVTTNKLLESNKHMEEEKLQEVPSVDLNAPVENKSLSLTPLTVLNNETKTLASATSLKPPVPNAKKDTPLKSMDLPASANTDMPKATFSFGVAPSNKMFEASSSTAPSMFGQPSQVPASVPGTSAPTLSMFNTSEGISTKTLFSQPSITSKPPPTLFQNTEANKVAAAAPMFSFGSNAPSSSGSSAALTLPAATEKPTFQFTFGSNSTSKTDGPSLFKSPFGAAESSASSSTFSLPAGATLSSGSNNNLGTSALGGANGLINANGLAGSSMAGSSMVGSTIGMAGSSLPLGNGNTLGGSNGLTVNPLSAGNSMQPESTLTSSTSGLFNNSIQKENVWSAGSSTQAPNPFVSNASSSSKPATFTFGSTTPFNAAGASSTPTFGAPSTAPQNIFGMNNQSNSTQSAMFSNSVPSQPATNMFGSPPPANTQMPMFGTPSIGATPTFGSPNPSIPTFEAQSLTPAPAPAFNFGAPQSTGIFGFGQQPQLQQPPMSQQHLQQSQLQSPQQSGVYSFGGAPAGAPQVQFSMGSGANPAGRRVRKAVRRNPQR